MEVVLYLLGPPPQCLTDGCFQDGRVYGTWNAVDHEIVRAVQARFAPISPFWSEGAAEALKGTRDIDYDNAGHFVRWLMERDGTKSVKELLLGAPFEDVYGQTLAEAEALDLAEAPWSYPADPRRGCNEPRLQGGNGSWTELVTINCDSDDTFRTLNVGTIRTIEVTDGGGHTLFVDGGEGVDVLRCQTEQITEPPPDDEPGAGIPDEGDGKHVGLPVFFEQGVEHHLELVPGLYRLRFSLDYANVRARGDVMVSLRAD